MKIFPVSALIGGIALISTISQFHQGAQSVLEVGRGAQDEMPDHPLEIKTMPERERRLKRQSPAVVMEEVKESTPKVLSTREVEPAEDALVAEDGTSKKKKRNQKQLKQQLSPETEVNNGGEGSVIQDNTVEKTLTSLSEKEVQIGDDFQKKKRRTKKNKTAAAEENSAATTEEVTTTETTAMVPEKEEEPRKAAEKRAAWKKRKAEAKAASAPKMGTENANVADGEAAGKTPEEETEVAEKMILGEKDGAARKSLEKRAAWKKRMAAQKKAAEISSAAQEEATPTTAETAAAETTRDTEETTMSGKEFSHVETEQEEVARKALEKRAAWKKRMAEAKAAQEEGAQKVGEGGELDSSKKEQKKRRRGRRKKEQDSGDLLNQLADQVLAEDRPEQKVAEKNGGDAKNNAEAKSDQTEEGLAKEDAEAEEVTEEEQNDSSKSETTAQEEVQPPALSTRPLSRISLELDPVQVPEDVESMIQKVMEQRKLTSWANAAAIKNILRLVWLKDNRYDKENDFLVFFHPLKSGGTSVSEILDSVGGVLPGSHESGHMDLQKWKVQYAEDHQKTNITKEDWWAQHRVIYSHHHYRRPNASPIPASKQFVYNLVKQESKKRARQITMVREPLAFVASNMNEWACRFNKWSKMGEKYKFPTNDSPNACYGYTLANLTDIRIRSNKEFCANKTFAEINADKNVKRKRMCKGLLKQGKIDDTPHCNSATDFMQQYDYRDSILGHLGHYPRSMRGPAQDYVAAAMEFLGGVDTMTSGSTTDYYGDMMWFGVTERMKESMCLLHYQLQIPYVETPRKRVKTCRPTTYWTDGEKAQFYARESLAVTFHDAASAILDVQLAKMKYEIRAQLEKGGISADGQAYPFVPSDCWMDEDTSNTSTK